MNDLLMKAIKECKVIQAEKFLFSLFQNVSERSVHLKMYPNYFLNDFQRKTHVLQGFGML